MKLSADFNHPGGGVPSSQPVQTVAIEDQVNFFIETIRELVSNDELEDAAQIMRPFLEPLDDDMGQMAISLNARLRNINRERDEETITNEDYRVSRAKIRKAMLNYVNDELPQKIALRRRMEALKAMTTANPVVPLAPVGRTYEASPKGVLEKVIGDKNEMLPTAWLAKALLASKSVCRVLVGGRADGTGFLLKGGYVMTNAHVLPNAAKVAKAEIEFNFEEGENKTVRYKLDADSAKRSPVSALDYCIVKVIDNKKMPLKQWGYLELETREEVRKGDAANIIQHPGGGVKQLAFRANDVISVWGNKVFYMADTDHGSSGSPVFNDQWKVIALHSRGTGADDGGMQINANGEKAAANQGFAIVAIAKEAGLVEAQP